MDGRKYIVSSDIDETFQKNSLRPGALERKLKKIFGGFI
jgi:hypothetical protein